MEVRVKKRPSGTEEEEEERHDLVEFTITDEIFTVEDAIEACGFGWFQIKLTFFAGLLWSVDAMEIMVLSILGPEVRCDYSLEPYQEGLITTVVFFGMFLGAGLWGIFMDKFGRKTGLFIFCLFVSISSLVSAFAPNYITLLIFRGVVGFGISGSAQAATFYSEFLPAKNRAVCLVIMEFFWAAGTVSEVLLAMLLLGHLNLNWHWLLGFTAVPMFIDLLAFLVIPESPFYYVAAGHTGKARKVLEKVARDNGKKLPPGQLVSRGEKRWIELLRKDIREPKESTDGPVEEECVSDSSGELPNLVTAPLMKPKIEFTIGTRGRFFDLFSSVERMQLTFLLWVIWFGAAFCYYGVVLLTTELLNILKEQQEKSNLSSNVMQCIDSAPVPSHGNCTRLQTDDYVELLWTTGAEFPGLLLILFFIQKFGRKTTIATEFFIGVLFFLLMFICPINKFVLLAFVFGARGVIVGTFQAIFVYTPEVYPTSIRAVGLGTCSSVARLGAMITPFVAEVLVRTSIRGGEGVYAAVSFLCGVCALLLPIETKGQGLQESLET